ncbi:MATE family efflux transporter [Enterococcus sp. RIT-PI-f]|uniref:MATE family efflux transporter n=1 Tax=Enterococcus sp. RIT-PI-f TaxID=1690244 RepID=UPI0006B8C34C|nr:MATE family efflux transporter [Enterococcus sp. RIT-PI-f]KPG70070.1 multidrug transporter MatE [Enterococcus sp. RIT-PI-f]
MTQNQATRSTKEIDHTLLKMAFPAMIENVLETAVGFIDALMIAQIGIIAVAGVGVANALINVYLAVFIALGVGTSSLIARHIGAGTNDKASQVAQQSLLLTLAVGVLFGLCSVFFATPLLRMMGADTATLAAAKPFFQLVGGAALLIGTMTSFGSMLRATGDTKTPMYVGLITNVLNIVVDFLLIFGWGPFPALGVVGTAIGTIVARLIGSLLLYRKVQQSTIAFSFKEILRISDYAPLIHLTIPAALERLAMRLGQVLYFGLIVAIGTKTYAAHSIAGSIESFVYMPAYGIATATATMIGMSVGQKNDAETKKIIVAACKYAVLILSLLGICLFVGAPLFAGWFTSDPSAIIQVVTALRIDAFNQPGLAISLILTAVLQGMGDTKTPLYSTLFGMWGIRVIGVLVLGLSLQLGIAGVWLAIGLDLYARSCFLGWRLKKTLQNQIVIH